MKKRKILKRLELVEFTVETNEAILFERVRGLAELIKELQNEISGLREEQQAFTNFMRLINNGCHILPNEPSTSDEDRDCGSGEGG